MVDAIASGALRSSPATVAGPAGGRRRALEAEIGVQAPLAVAAGHRQVLATIRRSFAESRCREVPVFTDDVASSNYPVFKGPATL